MPTLNWLTRNEAVTLSEKSPYRLLEHDPKLSQLRDWLLPMLMNGQITVEQLIEEAVQA